MPLDIATELLITEARASRALDGDTIAITHSASERETPGYGCPYCGSVLNLASDDFAKSLLAYGYLLCCGYSPGDQERVRWLRASRLVRDGLPPDVGGPSETA